MKPQKKHINNGYRSKNGTGSGREHSGRIILQTAHAGPLKDFIEGSLGKKLLVSLSSQDPCTERYICTACYVSVKEVDQQLTLFQEGGSIVTDTIALKLLDLLKAFPGTVPSTLPNTPKTKPTSFCERTVDPDPHGDWYEWDDQGIAKPKNL